VLRVLVSSQVGRIPLASAPLALLLFARQSQGMVAAGLLVSGYTAGTAASAPMLARAADRWRQPPVLWASAVASAAGFALVVAAGHAFGLAVLGAVVAGAGAPPLEACLRTLWPALLAERLVHTAYALDIALQEVIFVVGPVIALGTAALAGPAAGLLTAALLQVLGTGWFATAAAVRHWRGVPAPRHWAGPLRSRRILLLLVAVLLVGAAVGSIAVAATGYAEVVVRTRSWGGWLLAAQASGALFGGLLYLRWPGGEHRRRLPVLAAALAVGYLPLPLTPGPAAMVPLMVASGLALPPLLTAVFVVVDGWAPPGTAAEAFAWVATAFTIGSATGSAIAGPLVDAGISWGFTVAPAAALLATATVTVIARRWPGPER
jgi:predicted MFS family arabinose efflux permease